MPTTLASRAGRERVARPAFVLAVLGGLLVAACLLSLNLGFISISPLDVLRTLAGRGTEQDELVLYEFRMPRIVTAILVGIGLATAGAILQGVSQNPLADPSLLGINACAGLAVFIYLVRSNYGAVDPSGASSTSFNRWAMPTWAIVGGIVGAALVYVLSYKRGTVLPSRLLLVGIAISFAAAAGIALLAMSVNPTLYAYAQSWLEGKLTTARWELVFVLFLWIALVTPFVFYKSHVINVLQLGDEIAGGLGTAVERQRRLLILCAVILTSVSVAVAGGIAFIGLIGPHMARRLVGANYRVLLPAAALVGAVLLVSADIVARNALEPFEIPTGIVVAIIGAPYFLYLLTRTSG